MNRNNPHTGRSEKSKRALILTFILAFIPRIYLAFTSVPLHTVADELGTFAIPAYLAGYDWSAVVSRANYYGQGYSVLLTPLFLLLQDPVHLYKAVCLVGGLLQSLLVFVAYSMARKLAPNRSESFYCFLAFFCSFFVSNKNTVNYNEHALVMIAWLISICLYHVLVSRTMYIKLGWSVGLALLLGYSLTIHTRAKIFWIALVLLTLLYGILCRRLLLSIPAYLLLAAEYVLAERIVDRVLRVFWLADGVTDIGNTVLTQGFSEVSFSPFLLPNWIGIIIGELNTVNVASGGIFILMILTACRLFTGMFRGAFLSPRDETKTIHGMLMLYFLTGIAGIILAMSVSWLPETPYEFGTDWYSLRAFSYIRYFMPFTGPFLLTGITAMAWQPGFDRRFRIRGFFLSVGISAMYLILVVPYICRADKSNAVTLVYRALSLSADQDTGFRTFALGTVLCLAVLLVFLICMSRRKYTAALFLGTLIVVHIYMYDAVTWDLRVQQENYACTDAVLDMSRQLKGNWPRGAEKIYVPEYVDRGHQEIWYQMQFILPDRRVIPGLPSDEEKEAVILTDLTADAPQLQIFLQKGYRMARLDENEVMLVRGEELLKQFSDAGISFTEGTEDYAEIWLQDGMTQAEIPVHSGEIRFEFAFEADALETVQVRRSEDQKILVQASAAEFESDGEGKAGAFLQTACGSGSVQIRVTPKEGTEAPSVCIRYAYLTQEYDVGTERKDQLFLLAERAGMLFPEGSGGPCVYIAGEKELTGRLRTDTLNDIFEKDVFTVMTAEAFAEEEAGPALVLTCFEWDRIWKLAEEYEIIDCSGDYILWGRRDLKTDLVSVIKDRTGKNYSGGGYVSMDLFRIHGSLFYTDEAGLNLPFGSYELVSRLHTRKSVPEAGSLTVYENTAGETSTEFVKKENYWEACIQIYNYNQEEYVSYLTRLSSGLIGKRTDVWLRRISPVVALDLYNLSPREGVVFDENGSLCSCGVEGAVNDGPWLEMAPGNYNLKVRLSVEDLNEDDAAVMTVKGDIGGICAHKIVYDEIRNLSGELVFDLPFTVDDEHAIEFVFDQTEGVQLKISSILIEKEM